MDDKSREVESAACEREAVARDGYLEVHVRPETHAGGKQAAIELVASRCARCDARRVLVVCTDRESPRDENEAYWAGEATASRLGAVRTAVLVTARPITSLDDFAAQVARDRGADFRFFANRDDAVHWLTQP